MVIRCLIKNIIISIVVSHYFYASFALSATTDYVYCTYLKGLPQNENEGKYLLLKESNGFSTAACAGESSAGRCMDSIDAKYHVGKQWEAYYICDAHYINCELAGQANYTIYKIGFSYYARPASNLVDVAAIASKHPSCYKETGFKPRRD